MCDWTYGHLNDFGTREQFDNFRGDLRFGLLETEFPFGIHFEDPRLCQADEVRLRPGWVVGIAVNDQANLVGGKEVLVTFQEFQDALFFRAHAMPWGISVGKAPVLSSK